MKQYRIITLVTICLIVVASVQVFSISSQLLSYFVTSRQSVSGEHVTDTVLSSTGEFDRTADSYVFNNVTRPLPVAAYDFSSRYTDSTVLGATTATKKIVVDLSKQRVYAYEDNKLAFNFLVSTGKWGATPVGKYRIWYKVRAQAMKGGDKNLGTYYYLPNVQWVQYFNQGIGFHSTYWHNNFGYPMSHGCVNMTTADAETLYYWANPTMPDGVRIFRSNTVNPGTEVEVVKEWKAS